jgi:hypothetical protein
MKITTFLLFVLSLALYASTGNQTIVTPETALEAYINSDDKTYKWEKREKIQLPMVSGLRSEAYITKMA